MKIASWNIENIYNRDKTLDRSNWNKCLSDWVSELDLLMGRIIKSPNDMERIRELSFLLGFEKINVHPYGVLRKKQGELFLKLGSFERETKASERTDWSGWVPLSTRGIDQEAILNKARLIAEIDADVLVLQEVEDKASLIDFNTFYLKEFEKKPYDQILVLEGNDPRGLGMGIMTKNGYRVDTVKSHGSMHTERSEPIFGVDCQEYTIMPPQGETIYVLSTQFSQGNQAKRKLQARTVAEIYDKMRAEGKEKILICGTLNDVSYSDCLSPLLAETDLEDISKHPTFLPDRDKGKDAGYFRLGAYRMGVNIKQKDYMLLSYGMCQKIIGSGLDRRVMWPDRNGKWEVYPSLRNREQAASSHPLIWGEWN